MAMASPGTSTDDVVAVGERVTAALLKLPFVETVAHQIGRAEAGEDTWSVDKSEFHIELKPVHSESEEEAQDIIDAAAATDTSTSIAAAVRSDPTLGGLAADAAVTEATGYGVMNVDGIDYLAAHFIVEVYV